MKVEMELWHLVLLLLAFFGCVGAFGKVLLAQFEKRLDERFKIQEEVRKEAQKRWDLAFSEIEALARKNERDLYELRIHMAENFVSRPDHVRGTSIVEAKVDGLAKRFEDFILRQGGAQKASQA